MNAATGKMPDAVARCRCYAGIDLAWTAGGSSGLAVLSQTGEVVFCSSGKWSDEDLVRLLETYQPVHTCVDSPLVVGNQEGGRAVDSMLMRHSFHGTHVKMFATSRNFMLRRYGGIRGERLAEEFRRSAVGEFPRSLSETYPAAAIASLFPGIPPSAHKIRTVAGLDSALAGARKILSLLRQSGIRGELPKPPDLDSGGGSPRAGYKKFEDSLDALLCAVAALYHAEYDSSLVFSDGVNGFTVIPEPRFT